MVVKAGRGGPKRSISSAKQRGSQKVSSIIQSDISGSFVDEDMHRERTRQMGVKKYLEKSCYHRIKCSVANSLTALIFQNHV